MKWISVEDHLKPPPTKQCLRCKHIKPAAEFHKRNYHSTGLAPYCKDCTSEYKRQLNRKKALPPHRGENHYATKLNTEQVQEIKELLDLRNYHREAMRELSNNNLAQRFNVKKDVIASIAYGRTWKHVQ